MSFFINRILRSISDTLARNLLPQLESHLSSIKMLQADILVNVRGSDFHELRDAEFKVFSQCGDDGIIQYLIHKLELKNKTFIEFGVEDYLESNTRFLLMNDNWSGLIIDSSDANIRKINRQEIIWKYDLTAVSAFIDSENINQIISSRFSGDIGILHIDIDGNDYWIWDAIDCVEPDIVIIEYNSVFGKDRAITIPYDSKFDRTAYHHSNLFFGASLSALNFLAKKKGYYFIGANSTGNNAYFVKRKFSQVIEEVDVQEGYVESKFSESRDVNGKLNLLRGSNRRRVIADLPVFNVEKNCQERL
jgi:hypothetical protein